MISDRWLAGFMVKNEQDSALRIKPVMTTLLIILAFCRYNEFYNI